MHIYYKGLRISSKTALQNVEYIIHLINKKGSVGFISDIGLKDSELQDVLSINNDKVEDLAKQLVKVDALVTVKEPKYKPLFKEERDKYGYQYERSQSRYYLRKSIFLIWYLFLVLINDLTESERYKIKNKRIHIHFDKVLNGDYTKEPSIERDIYVYLETGIRKIIIHLIRRLLEQNKDYSIFDLDKSILSYYGIIEILLETKEDTHYTDTTIINHCSFLNSQLIHSLRLIHSNERREKQCNLYLRPTNCFLTNRKDNGEFSLITLCHETENKDKRYLYKDFDVTNLGPIEIKKELIRDKTEVVCKDFAIYIAHNSPIHNEIGALLMWIRKFNFRFYRQLSPSMSVNIKYKNTKDSMFLTASGRQYNPLCSISKVVRDELLAHEGIINVGKFDLSGAILQIAKALNNNAYEIDEDLKAELLKNNYKTINGKPFTKDDLKPLSMRFFFEPTINVAWAHYCFSCLKHNRKPKIDEETFEQMYYDFQYLVGGTSTFRYNIFLYESLVELKVIYKLEQLNPRIKLANVYDCFFWDTKQISEKTVKRLIVESTNEVISFVRKLHTADKCDYSRLCAEPYKRLIEENE